MIFVKARCTIGRIPIPMFLKKFCKYTKIEGLTKKGAFESKQLFDLDFIFLETSGYS